MYWPVRPLLWSSILSSRLLDAAPPAANAGPDQTDVLMSPLLVPPIHEGSWADPAVIAAAAACGVLALAPPSAKLKDEGRQISGVFTLPDDGRAKGQTRADLKAVR
jgi:hypothetical protein